MSRTPTINIDYTNRDYEAYRTMMIEDLQRKMPEYTDTSQTDAGIVILECLANGLDICSLYTDIIANDVLLPTTQDRRIAVLIARQLGYIAKNQTASVFEQVFVLNSAVDKDVVIPQGTKIHTQESSDAETVYFETLDGLTIPQGMLGNEVDENSKYKYTVNVAQGSTVNEDSLGSSNGQPYQSFKLNYPNVLPDTIALYVDEGSGFEFWTQVSSLMSSSEDSKVYTINVDDFDYCYIEFGNGVRGKIPNAFANGILATYRIGGGDVGNVKPNTINVVQDSIAYVESTFNPYQPLVSGHEKEDIEEIRENGPAAFRTRDRAITEFDYADLLRINFYEVLDAIGIKDATMRIKMNLYYYMRPNYTMTPTLLDSITTFFSTRTIPGTVLTINPNEYYTVDIIANLVIDPNYYIDTVDTPVKNYITNTYFAEGNFKFNDTLVKSDLESSVKSAVGGVRSFRITTPMDDIIKPTELYQIIKLGTITLNISGGKVREV